MQIVEHEHDRAFDANQCVAEVHDPCCPVRRTATRQPLEHLTRDLRHPVDGRRNVPHEHHDVVVVLVDCDPRKRPTIGLGPLCE